ncbi:HAMP domain-containing sensor histidine kinase [Streptococcus caprae]|uniref:Signal transduction histidine-protein kinase ArlS n=1 Tax=Streptococcus caprae TaxID=1640501 RepID=A0ABV8CW54_9STRE
MKYLLLGEQNRITDNITLIKDRLSESDEVLTVGSITSILYKNATTDTLVDNNGSYYILRAERDITNMLYSNQKLFVYDPDGDLIFTSSEDADNPKMTELNKIETVRTKSDMVYVLTEAVQDKSGQLIGYVQVSHELTYYDEMRQNLSYVIIAMGVVALVLILLITIFTTREFLKPLIQFQQIMGEITQNPNSLDRRTNLKTNDEIQDLSEMFDGMLDRLEEHNQLQTRFVSDISHELRTPVAVIKGHLGLLKRWGKDDPEVLEESLEASYEETERMSLMINDMLDTIRVQGNLEDHLRDTAFLPDSVRTVVGNFKLLHPTATIKTVIGQAIPMAKIYKNHFEQMLTILLDNALKYSPNHQEIEVSLTRVENQIELIVSDHGEGISEDDLNHIFERFYRTDLSRNRTSTKSGLGIGLSILKKISDAYACSVSVASQLGQGTTFKVLVPVVSEEDLVY